MISQRMEHRETYPSVAYLPQIGQMDFLINPQTAQVLNRAETCAHTLEQPDMDQLSTDAYRRAFTAIESIANSKMSGKQIDVFDFFKRRAGAATSRFSESASSEAEALDITKAVETATDLGNDKVSVSAFETIHRDLLAGTHQAKYQCQFRKEDKQIGGSRFHSFGSPYATPAPESIPAYLADLAAFCNNDDIPAIAQIALAHVQFLGIHPFARANGKTARAVVHLMMRRRSITTKIIVPISASIMTSPHDYQTGIAQTLEALCQGECIHQAINNWLAYFSNCCIDAAETALSFKERSMSLQLNWERKVGARSDSATSLLIKALPAIPIFTAATASAYIDRSFKRTTSAIDELVSEGVVVQITQGKRNRVFECPEIMSSYSDIRGFQ